MRFHLRPVLALTALVVLNLAVRPTFGVMYSHAVFALTMLSLLIGLVASLAADRPLFWRGGLADRQETDGDTYLLACAALALGALNIISTDLAYVDVMWARRLLVLFALVGFIITAAVAFSQNSIFRSTQSLGPNSYRGFLAAALLLGLSLRSCVLIASPDPVIDVYSLLNQCTDHVLAGRNPYVSEIVSPYETSRAAEFNVIEPRDPRPAGYPPHPYLLATPFRTIGADARWANVLWDGVAAAALYLVACRRGRPYAGYLAASLWLFFPRTTFMIEQAWYEPMIGGLLGIGFWLVEGAGWRQWLGYILVGLGMTAKQYGLPMLPALAWPHRQHWLKILVGLLAGALVMLPWYLWSPTDFLDIVVWKHLRRPPQEFRALTIAGGCYQLLGTLPDRRVMWAIAAVLIAAVSWRAPRQGAATALALGTSLLIFCVFHTQGFFNYFYLCQYLWLMGFVGMLVDVKSPPETQSG
jgi:hypothetical protein